MRSWHELGATLAVVMTLAACGTDFEPTSDPPGDDEGEMIEVEADACETSYLDYTNFGAPFVTSWCRGCHSSELPAAMRQKSPADVNFDSQADVIAWTTRIRARAATLQPTMPPAGGPTAEERALLAEWLACGAR